MNSQLSFDDAQEIEEPEQDQAEVDAADEPAGDGKRRPEPGRYLFWCRPCLHWWPADNGQSCPRCGAESTQAQPTYHSAEAAAMRDL